jgi:hypothetical protein
VLNRDGIGPGAIKDQSGADISAGALMLGQYADLLYNGTNWILLQQQLATLAAPHCGRLVFVSATALSFKPFNSDRIKINGAIYPIPSAGITGLANTGVFVGGVAGQNLGAIGAYYVYAFNNSGVITADFVPTSTPHVTSTTAGNVGVEIKSSDDTRTLIGFIGTNASSQFTDTPASRLVISWFNRRNIAIMGTAGTGSTASGAGAELNTSLRALFVSWADESMMIGVTANASNASGGFMQIWANINAVSNSGLSAQVQSFAAGAQVGLTAVGAVTPAEIYSYLTAFGTVTAGTGNFSYNVTGLIRG